MDLQELRKTLPHGAIKQIAGKVGVNSSEVSRIFSGLKPKKYNEVIKATAEYLTEYKAKEMEAMKALNEVINLKDS